MDSLTLTMEKGKMGKLVYLVLLAYGLVFINCEQAIAQRIEPVQYFSHDGTPNTFIKDEDGQLYQYEYDENFQLKSISPYNYVVDTVWYSADRIFNFEKCHKSIESSFLLNYEGLYKQFDGRGNVIESGCYFEGARIGNWYTFNERGDTLSCINYNRELHSWTVAHGIAWQRYSNLTTEWIGTYSYGRMVGDWVWFYNNGNPRIEAQYRNNLPVGTYREYHPNGDIALVGELHTIDFKPGVVWSREREESIIQAETSKTKCSYCPVSAPFKDIRSIKVGKWVSYNIDGTDSIVIDYSTMIVDSCLMAPTSTIIDSYSFKDHNNRVCKIHGKP